MNLWPKVTEREIEGKRWLVIDGRDRGFSCPLMLPVSSIQCIKANAWPSSYPGAYCIKAADMEIIVDADSLPADLKPCG